MKRALSIGYSTCPNDTYIFDALVHDKIKHDFRFNPELQDVETLNQLALKESLDISKVSIHAWFHMTEHYQLLDSGAALGRGCGPILIGKDNRIPKSGKIALPGKLTTAALLFQIAIPGDFELIQMPFDHIMPAVISGEVEAGVIIHESRFTFQNYGLVQKIDLGEWWETETKCMIPLGGIMIHQQLDRDIKFKVSELIASSIHFADHHPQEGWDYIKQHAKELSDDVIKQHINLYVNMYSKSLKPEGRRAIIELYNRAVINEVIPALPKGNISDLILPEKNIY